MKVITAKTMASLEATAYEQGYSEESFMEKAGIGIAAATMDFIDYNELPRQVLLLCGKGNNGGDAFVAGFHLLKENYSVTAILIESWEKCSRLCHKNGIRFQTAGGTIIQNLSENLSDFSIILDGIFGTGFKGEVQEPYTTLIQQANNSCIPILAIDIPSGLNGSTGETGSTVIKATQTIFLGLPKTGFFLRNGWNYIGSLHYVNFGLPNPIIEQAQGDFEVLSQHKAVSLLPPIPRNRHKYQAGQVIGLAGSINMPGAALLSSWAALKGGCGIVRLLHQVGMEFVLANSPYELIKIPYKYDEFEEIISLMEKGKATFIGPGLGRSQEVKNLLTSVIPHLTKPCVMDADALTLFAEVSFKLPEQTIFTPHTGEMQRLLQLDTKLELNQETLDLCQNYVEKHRLTLILKGAPTFIFHPTKPILVNVTGDPGMATAGSGDVLTGLIASLLAQGLDCHQAAILGVFLHGKAGEYAAMNLSSYCVTATDLIDYFSDAYQELSKDK